MSVQKQCLSAVPSSIGGMEHLQFHNIKLLVSVLLTPVPRIIILLLQKFSGGVINDLGKVISKEKGKLKAVFLCHSKDIIDPCLSQILV